MFFGKQKKTAVYIFRLQSENVKKDFDQLADRKASLPTRPFFQFLFWKMGFPGKRNHPVPGAHAARYGEDWRGL